jgi:glycerophosphoryl diester phosphodiesterase
MQIPDWVFRLQPVADGFYEILFALRSQFLRIRELFLAPQAPKTRARAKSKISPATWSRVVAHRGLSGHPTIQENTFEAFDWARRWGCAIELDLQLCQCGQWIVFHDSTFQGRPIAEWERSAIRRLAPQIPFPEELRPWWPDCPMWFLEIKVQAAWQLPQAISAFLEALPSWNLPQEQTTLISLDSQVLTLLRAQGWRGALAWVYLFAPRAFAKVQEQIPDCGILGYFATFPKSFANVPKIQGLGFANHPHTLRYYLQKQGKPWVFTDRLDRLIKSQT